MAAALTIDQANQIAGEMARVDACDVDLRLWDITSAAGGTESHAPMTRQQFIKFLAAWVAIDEQDAAQENVAPEDACPRCGERDQDNLLWQEDGVIHCTNCDAWYVPRVR